MKNLFTNIVEAIHIFIIVSVLIRHIRKGLWKTLWREIKEPGYMSQSQFDSCLARAKAMIFESIEVAIKVFGLMIAQHRSSKKHRENHSEEISRLTSSLEASSVKMSTRAWWQG